MAKAKNRIVLLIIAGIAIFSINSCNVTKKYEKEEEANIQNYLNNHSSLHYDKKATGLYYLDDVVGTGAQVVTGDSVFLMFNVYYLNGTKIGTNYGTTDTLRRKAGIGDFIAGFDEAVGYMKAGGKAKIVVPSYLAYGSSGYIMPAYTTLLYDIYLVRLSSNSTGK
jgi:FKBP-type peptidyl-prolyl cis-trans isomerase